MSLPTDAKPQPAQSRGSWKIALFLILAVAILGAVPTGIHVYHLVTLGVNWGEVPFARHQKMLWARNWMCATGPGETARLPVEGQQIDTFMGVLLRVQACPNSDVLVRTVTADRTGRAVWIAAEGFALEDASLTGGMRALAQEAHTAATDKAGGSNFSIMCQQWKEGGADSGRVVRVVSLPEGCIREVIDILRGNIVSVETVPCSAECVPASE